MNCKSFIDLNPVEKAEYLGRIVIAVQTNESAFKAGQRIINSCKKLGVYDRTDVQLGSSHTNLIDKPKGENKTEIYYEEV